VTNRVTYAPQDFQKAQRQAEIDHESKRLVILLDRVKKQIATMEANWNMPKPPATSKAAPTPDRSPAEN
jgi:hypothetical protein